MDSENITILEKYLNLLRFKKFMIIHVIGFTYVVIMSVYFIGKNLLDGNLITAFGFCIATSFIYIFLRVFQYYWTKKGAENSYTFFFTGKRKK